MSFHLIVYVLFSFISIPLSLSSHLRTSGSALGLLLVFRTNTAYNRFWEGRRIWERILTSLRDLGRMTVVYGDVIESTRVERILHLLCAFPLGVSLLIILYFRTLSLAYSYFARHVRILP
jgi:predicted membrane chloride channel (bestrophin family)